MATGSEEHRMIERAANRVLQGQPASLVERTAKATIYKADADNGYVVYFAVLAPNEGSDDETEKAKAAVRDIVKDHYGE